MPSATRDERLKAYWRRFEESSEHFLGDVPTTLFFAGKDWVPEPIGTGFFVTTGSRFFLITAKHVLEDATAQRPVHYFIGHQRTMRFHEAISHPTADVACIEVSEDTIPQCTVIHAFAILREQIPRVNRAYYLCGCPAAGTEHKFSSKTTFFRRKRLMLMSPDDSVYAPHWNPRHTLLLSFDRKRMGRLSSGARVSMAPPKGMSGSPIFIHHPSTPERPMWREWSLVSMLSEWRPRPSQRYMVGEDAGAILECLMLAGVDAATV